MAYNRILKKTVKRYWKQGLLTLVLIYFFNKSFGSFKLKQSDLGIRNVPTKIITKWIIVTSINKPTEQLNKLASVKDFHLLVVADKKTDPEWSHSNKNVIFLSLDKQYILGYETTEFTPFNSYNRKNIGYLYAIANGAQYIYDTDDDYGPLFDLNEYFIFKNSDYGLTFECQATSRSINPYAHFGQPLVWPRGHPLSEITKTHVNKYIGGKRKTSTIQQGLVDGYPDVDAHFRSIKIGDNKRANISFDKTAPSVQYPSFRMTPYNSQSTFFHTRAFWSLYLPSRVSPRITHIWRSYWAQRLMWLLDDTVTVLGPRSFQTPPTIDMKSVKQEAELHWKTEILIDLLFEWKCHKFSFYDCMMDLSIKMAEKEIWDNEEVSTIQAWINDLKSIGYEEPHIVNTENSFDVDLCGSKRFKEINKNVHDNKYTFGKIPYFAVRYTPNFQENLDLQNYEGHSIRTYNRLASLRYFEQFCSKQKVKLDYDITGTFRKQDESNDFVLLVMFNEESSSLSIELMHHLYGEKFVNVVFCGNSLMESKFAATKQTYYQKFDSYTFINLNDMKDGQFNYVCMAKAIEMNFNTKGILMISSKTFLKYWDLDGLDKSKIWYPQKILIGKKVDTNEKQKTPNKREFNRLIHYLNNAKSNRKLTIENKHWLEEFSDLLVLNRGLEEVKHPLVDWNGNILPIQIIKSDTYYIPANKFEKYIYFSNLFEQHLVASDIAVPMILTGITGYSDSLVIFPQIESGTEAFKSISIKNQFYFINPMFSAELSEAASFCQHIIQNHWL